MEERVQALTTQLRQSSTVSQFRTLEHVSYLHLQDESGYGIIFQSLGELGRLISLKEYLKWDRKKGVQRNLEARLHLAAELATSVFYFFVVG